MNKELSAIEWKKQAIHIIETLETQIASLKARQDQPIAIVGAACRFPGAPDLGAYWEVLDKGVEVITEVPGERWDIDSRYDPNPAAPGKMTTRHGGFLEQLDRFDAQFFGIAPREAVSMDPQHRLLLEVGWEALEHAGLAPDRLLGVNAGVYIGISNNDYQLWMGERGYETLDAYMGTGTAHSAGVGRLSYFWGLQGPNVAVDTACSSSLVAIGHACDALRLGKCDLALTGAVNTIITPHMHIAFSKARMLSPDGRCKTFDAAANGYVRSEGCGVVVLKRLADAQRDGDRVLAVIRGCAVNQDGRSSGLTVPNGPAQERVIRAALAQAGLAPHQVDYLEAHGTGTALGDPIEIQAAAAALGGGRPADRPLLVGSVKTNLGHLEAAAGVAGLIKVVLAMQHRRIPRQLHFRDPNPHVPWDRLPVRVTDQECPWPGGDGRPPVAGVSSFGFSGTNAHVVLEGPPAAPPTPAAPPERAAHVLPLSAKAPAALRQLAGRYADWLGGHPGCDLGDVCHTAGVGRAHLEYRAAVLACDPGQAVEALRALEQGGAHPDLCAGRPGEAKLALLFTGQGSQYPGMAKGLYDTQPAFRAALDRCADLLGEELDRPLLDVLFSQAEGMAPSAGNGKAARGPSPLDDTRYAQPALFAVEAALYELYRSWGLQPAAVLGHSLGEYAAAYAAGVFGLADGIRLVARRGRLMGALPAGGGMAAVFAPAAEVEAAVAAAGAGLAVAAYNGGHTVVSGPRGPLEALLGQFAARGVRCTRLRAGHAFHSPLVEPALEAFERAAAAVAYRPAELPLLSNVSGRPLPAGAVPDAAYWVRHAREPVQWARAVASLAELGCTALLELGPQPTLAGLALACWPAGPVPAAVAALRRGEADDRQAGRALAELYAAGLTPDFAAWDRPWPRRKLALPSYPFQRQRFWAEPPARRAIPGQPAHPLLGVKLRLAESAEQRYEQLLSGDCPPWVADHRVFDQVVFPAAGYIELALAAAGEGLAIEQLAIEAPLTLSDERFVQTVVRPRGLIEIFAQSGDAKWQRHVHARAVPTGSTVREPADLAALRLRCRTNLDVAALYQRLAAAGLGYGPSFKTLHQLHVGDGEVLAELRLPRDLANHRAYRLPPMLLDGALQALAGLDADGQERVYLPVGVERVQLYGPIGSVVLAHGRLREAGGERRFDLTILDEAGRPLAEIESVRLRPATRRALRQLLGGEADTLLYSVRWQQVALPQADTDRAGGWLVLGEEAARGPVGDAFDRLGQRVRAGAPAHAPILLDQLTGHAGHNGAAVPLTGVVWFVPPSDAAGGVLDGARRLVEPLLEMIRRLLDRGVSLPGGLNLITRRAVASEPGEDVDPLQASLWGLGRALQAEQPQLNTRLIDADAPSPATLAQVILTRPEPQLALRAGHVFVPRLSPHAQDKPLTPPATGDYRLAVSQRGSIDRLQFEPVEPAVAAGEVQIEVHAAGLNFRDVLNALGAYPGDPGALGGEVAGVVTAVGEGVSHLAPGDRVFGFAAGGLATRCTAAAEVVCRIPEGLDFAAAATVPTTFCTAQAAFELTSLRGGERVLIHAAAGGVGLAAVALARALGAEVYATASAGKQDYLRGLGVRYIYDSRSTAFAEQIRADTGGAGVDVVLNSLTSEGFIAASVRALASGGRFVEIGKRDIWSMERMRRVRPDVGYHILALDEWIVQQPRRVGALLAGIAARLAGELQPLRRRVYALAEAVAAFRTMQQARHVGKIVLTVTRPQPRRDGGYLISGGLGELGQAAAARLAEEGAGCIVLVGRRGPGSDVLQRLEDLRQRHGCVIHAEAADVGDAGAVASVVDRFGREWPPLRGIIHAAGVLDDGVLAEQNWERFERVLKSKALGAWHLHQHSRHLPLDFFVLYSSVASVLGSAGQANYALANAFLDGLAEHRRAQGLVATGVNWGPWAGAGMAGEAPVRARLEQQGLVPLKADRAHSALARLVAAGVSGVVLDADWQQMSRHLGDVQPPLLGQLLTPRSSQGDSGLAHRLRATPTAARTGVLSEHLQEELRHILRLAERPAVNSGFFDLGMDSLMAVELRNRLQAQLGEACQLSNTLTFDYPTIQRLAEQLAKQFGAPDEGQGRNGGGAGHTDRGQVRDTIQQLERATHSEIVDELQRLLLAEDPDDRK